MSQFLHLAKRGLLFMLISLWILPAFAQNGSECYKPITGFGTQVNPIRNSLICLDCDRTGINNVTDADKNNFANLSQFASLVNGNGITVKQTSADYPAGYYAGFVVALGNDLNVNVLNAISISTYKDDVLQQTATGVTLKATPVLGGSTGRAYLYFETSQSFDEVRFIFSSTASVLSEVRVYYAMAFDPNCGTLENNAICDDAIQGNGTTVTYNGGLVCALCALINSNNLVDADKNNYATLTMPAAALSTVSVGVLDEKNIYPAGNKAGFVIAPDQANTILDANLLNTITIETYLFGTLQESQTFSSGSGLLSVSALGFNSNQKIKLGFTTTKNFNEVKLRVNQPVGVTLGALRIFYAFEEPNGCGDCTQALTTDKPSPYTGEIVGSATGFYGSLLSLGSISNTSNIVTPSLTDYASYNPLLNLLGGGARFTVQNDGPLFPANSFAGFVIAKEGALVDVSLLGGVKIRVFNGSTFVEEKTGAALLTAGVLSGSAGLTTLGFTPSAQFNRIQIQFDQGLLGASLGGNYRIYYAFVITDVDGDGTPDCFDACPSGDNSIDTDGDGIPDACDNCNGNSFKSPIKDTDADGVADACDADSDNDGIADVVEDANNDGDPTNDDFDGDGVPNYQDLDSDNDGINDINESGIDAATVATLDADNDGVIDASVPKGNNGMANAVETNDNSNASVNYTLKNTDGDAKPDYLDLDSDNDGINDIIESGHPGLIDANNDGVVDGPDADGDGIQDSADGNDAVFGDANNPAVKDTDGDSVPDFRDLDSDNDGINDIIESGHPGLIDANDDGIVDGPDADGDGIQDSADGNDAVFGDANETAPKDTDGDNVPDFRDLDSDNDGINDIIESGHPGLIDANNDGVVDGPDADGDGIQDSADGNDAVFGDAGEIAPRDTDGDNVPDFRDLDSDNDGIGDLVESGHPGLIDADNDGVVDGPDADGDGIQDSADGNDNLFGDAATPAPKDTDADGTPDYRDLDSDNDGTKDIVEGGHGFLDQDGDGRVDNPTDPDGDGIANNGGLDTKPNEFGGIASPAVPDLTPSTRVSSTGFSIASQTERVIVIDVSEIAGNPTNNAAVPVRVRVLKSDNFVYTFDDAASSANVPGLITVNNADWDLTTNSSTQMLFTLKPGKNISASGLSSIAVKLKVVTGASRGTDNFNVSIIAGSGTETNFNNNLVDRILNIF
ncbi:hypothetical protein WG954_06840 [Lacibacter sp. H375]|uniref:hypothetical protein n=1 Tax=Lacibacter sp. H375 TaxID=3133424 RepID=UPI0030C31858